MSPRRSQLRASTTPPPSHFHHRPGGPMLRHRPTRSGLAISAISALLLLVWIGATFAAPLDPSGDLDTGFSGDGQTSANFAEVLSFGEARAVAIQSTGKIV